MLALGDSYTIGESIDTEKNWPHQLQSALHNGGIEIDVEIIATTGWRTDELITATENQAPVGPYDLVTLLIGVNNQYQGRPFEQYEKEAKELIEIAISRAGNEASSVLIVSIPDYAYSSYGKSLEKEGISEELDRYNAYMSEQAEAYGIPFIDITQISRSHDQTLIAKDGLHPSAKQYGMWVDKMMNEAIEILQATD